MYLASFRYSPNCYPLRPTVTDTVPNSRYSSRTLSDARAIRTRSDLGSLLPPRPLLLPPFSPPSPSSTTTAVLSPVGLSHALTIVAALPLYACVRVGARQSVASGRVIMRFVLSHSLLYRLSVPLSALRGPLSCSRTLLLRPPRGFISRSPRR